MATSDFRLEEHFVLYIDFLGSSDAARNWSEERTKPLLELLSELAASKAAFDISGGAQSDGSYKFNITAEFSTFSDHILASYPASMIETARETDPRLIELVLNMVLDQVQKIVGIIAIKALNIGLLIRGGFTIGKLYHSSNVVFGEGLVDAYELENNVAIYPRVVVSPRVYTLLPKGNRRMLSILNASRLMKDRDGIWHLDYFNRLIGLLKAAKKSPEDIEAWRKTTLKEIEQQIKNFEAKERLNELKKWSWFREHFLAVTSPYPE